MATTKQPESLVCPECGYDGEPDEEGKCPECGAKMEPMKAGAAKVKATSPEDEKPALMVCPKCEYKGPPDEDGKCPECGAVMVKPEPEKGKKAGRTKAGRTLSAANEASLRTALTAITAILDQVKPSEGSVPETLPEPPKPAPAPPADPPEVTDGSSTPEGPLNKPGGALSLAAAAQSVVEKLFDVSETDLPHLRKLAASVDGAIKSIEKSRRQRAVRKLFRVTC